jgi:cytochrome bd-type quinol oxidase subunit 1
LVAQFGFPAIGMAHAYGLALLVSLVSHQAPSNSGEDERTAQVITWAIVSPACALIAGWIAKQFL